jgi:hypothetical protein
MSGSPNSYEKMVLSHLEKVEQLPPEVQADIAKRVGIYLKLASAAKTDELLAALAAGAMQEQAKAIGKGTSSTMDPQWAGPARLRPRARALQGAGRVWPSPGVCLRA